MRQPNIRNAPLTAAEALREEFVQLNGPLPDYHAWLNQLPEEPRLWLLQKDHLKDPALLAEKLLTPATPLAQFLRDQLNSEIARSLGDLPPSTSRDDSALQPKAWRDPLSRAGGWRSSIASCSKKPSRTPLRGSGTPWPAFAPYSTPILAPPFASPGAAFAARLLLSACCKAWPLTICSPSSIICPPCRAVATSALGSLPGFITPVHLKKFSRR